MDNYQYYLEKSNKVAERIRELCRKKGVTFKQLSDELGISQSTVSRYIGRKAIEDKEAGGSMSLLFIIGAADVLKVDVSVFTGTEGIGEGLRSVMQRFKRRLENETSDPVKEVKFLLQSLTDNL